MKKTILVGSISLLLLTACSDENRVEIVEEQKELFSEDFQENIVKNELLNKFEINYEDVLNHLISNKLKYNENIIKESFMETPLYQITINLEGNKKSLININFEDNQSFLGFGRKKEKALLRNTTIFIDGYKIIDTPDDDFDTILKIEEESSKLKESLQLSSNTLINNVFLPLMKEENLDLDKEEHILKNKMQEREDVINEIEQTIDVIAALNSVLTIKSIPNIKDNKFLMNELDSLTNNIQSKTSFYDINMEEIETNFYKIKSKNLEYTLKIDIHENRITYQFSY